MTSAPKPGYKLTEIGVIPEEWEVNSFASLAQIERGKFSARPRNDPKFYNGDIPFIQTGDVTNSNGHITKYSQTLNADGLRVSRLFPRDTLFFTIAANIGDVGFASFDAACPDSLVAIAPKTGVDKYWLYFELARRKSLFESLATHNAQLNINLQKLRPVPLPLPPLPEQRAIATALSDVDALIASQERLIAKKRLLKQAAMQQLLSGRTRLPGFSGEWERKVMNDVADFLDHLRVPLNEFERAARKGDYPYCGANGVLDYVDGYVVDEEIILMAEDGGYFDEYNTRPIAYLMRGKCWVNNHAHILRAKCGIEQIFLFYSIVHKNILPFLANGTRAKLNKAELKKIEILFPSEQSEQRAIAEVLTDMDAELAALELRRDKTKALKQGMMQSLLTGTIRLLEDTTS